MHICTGMRTKNYEKLFDAIVVDKFIWNFDHVPVKEDADEYVVDQNGKEVFINGELETWYEFAINDGFEDYNDFFNYFHHHKKKTEIFICYVFERVELELEYRLLTEFFEV